MPFYSYTVKIMYLLFPKYEPKKYFCYCLCKRGGVRQMSMLVCKGEGVKNLQNLVYVVYEQPFI